MKEQQHHQSTHREVVYSKLTEDVIHKNKLPIYLPAYQNYDVKNKTSTIPIFQVLLILLGIALISIIDNDIINESIKFFLYLITIIILTIKIVKKIKWRRIENAKIRSVFTTALPPSLVILELSIFGFFGISWLRGYYGNDIWDGAFTPLGVITAGTITVIGTVSAAYIVFTNGEEQRDSDEKRNNSELEQKEMFENRQHFFESKKYLNERFSQVLNSLINTENLPQPKKKISEIEIFEILDIFEEWQALEDHIISSKEYKDSLKQIKRKEEMLLKFIFDNVNDTSLINLSDRKFANLNFDGFIFENVNMQKSQFIDCNLNNSIIINSNISSALFNNSKENRVDIELLKISHGINFPDLQGYVKVRETRCGRGRNLINWLDSISKGGYISGGFIRQRNTNQTKSISNLFFIRTNINIIENGSLQFINCIFLDCNYSISTNHFDGELLFSNCIFIGDGVPQEILRNNQLIESNTLGTLEGWEINPFHKNSIKERIYKNFDFDSDLNNIYYSKISMLDYIIKSKIPLREIIGPAPIIRGNILDSDNSRKFGHIIIRIRMILWLQNTSVHYFASPNENLIDNQPPLFNI